jgi:hypothetical protein
MLETSDTWMRESRLRMLDADLHREAETGKPMLFNPGDKVRVVHVGDNAFIKHGWRGVVLDHSYAPWVAFDKQTHLGDPCNPYAIEGWRPGHMDCLEQSQLELAP